MIKKKDLVLFLISGFLTGIFASLLFSHLGYNKTFGISVWSLIIFCPIIYIFGLLLGVYLSRLWGFFHQFARFCAVGFLGAVIDNGVVAILVSLTGVTAGRYFPLVRAGGIIVAFINNYLWNKYWSFEAGKTSGKGAEFLRFMAVSIVGMLTIVVLSTIVVNLNRPQNLSPKTWASIATVIGSAGALLVNFTGYKKIVFKPSRGYDTLNNIN